MLARLVRELPAGQLTYEPKWDGFRCIAFVERGLVDLRSRHDRPLARYFPELEAAFTALADASDGFVVDGEILPEPGDRHDFAALLSRLHPAASRVERLSRETPARFVAFDVLSIGERDVRDEPFAVRRQLLEELLPLDGVVATTASTRDPVVASGWLATAGNGVDGVVAKDDDLRYLAGKRAMIKVKPERTADCVVGGIRIYEAGAVGTLLLGLYDENDVLRHVGVVTQLPHTERVALFDDLAPLAVRLEEHPWRDGFTMGASPIGRLPGAATRWRPDMARHGWLPLRPERVVEVAFDQVDVDRFRHPARLRRWRPDRTAESCRLEQITSVPARDPRSLAATGAP
jgi:ATP-dependent DNA ligase